MEIAAGYLSSFFYWFAAVVVDLAAEAAEIAVAVAAETTADVAAAAETTADAAAAAVQTITAADATLLAANCLQLT